MFISIKGICTNFFGAGYDKVIILICAILPIILFIGMSNILGTQFLLPTKRQKEFYSISCMWCDSKLYIEFNINL